MLGIMASSADAALRSLLPLVTRAARALPSTLCPCVRREGRVPSPRRLCWDFLAHGPVSDSEATEARWQTVAQRLYQRVSTIMTITNGANK
jgi:hypothetical protein